MSTKQDITMDAGTTWKITFAAHYSDGSAMPLTSGDDVIFRVSDTDGTVMLDKRIDEGITVVDESAGTVEIVVSVSDQEHNQVGAGGAYYYAIQVTHDDESDVQAEGRLTVTYNLFSAVAAPYLMTFHTRFPEFTEDDNVLSLYIKDAVDLVNKAGVFDADEEPIAIIYLAAHLMQTRLLAKQNYEAGGLSTGAVQMIRVEDRTVSYSNTTASSLTKSFLGQTYYGQQYLAMLRAHPQWLLRA